MCSIQIIRREFGIAERRKQKAKSKEQKSKRE
jgi:hypothetical protein